MQFSTYEVDLVTGELWKCGVAFKLARQPFEILAYLVSRPGQLVSREELRAQLWPHETFVDFDHGLNAAMNKLRLALSDSAENPKYIETLPRRGYRFIGRIELPPSEPEDRRLRSEPIKSSTTNTDLNAHPAAIAAKGAPVLVGSASSLETAPSTERWGVLLLYGVAAVLAFSIFWVLKEKFQQPSMGHQNVAAADTFVKLSPITNLSDRTSQPAFSPDGSRVAFVREGFLDENSGIWSKHISGDALLQLTKSDADCCPVWSPDGQWLAFSRVSGSFRTVYKIASNGGELHELFTTVALADHARLDWSPDGKSIAYAAQGAEGSSAIFLRSLEDRRTRQISFPSALEQDWGPAFSPDGNRIAFVRMQNIMVVGLEGKEIQNLIKTPGHILGSPTWTPDGLSIVFASSNADGPKLTRISASGDKAASIRETGDLALNPAIAKRGFRLACDRLTVASSIDQVDLSRPHVKARTLVSSSGGKSGGAQISHDGTKLVFQSDRSGESDIWISDRDGQNPVRITVLGTASAPSWSPDDKEIAFEARVRPEAAADGIYLVKSSGGEPWPLVHDTSSSRAPRWSNDGKWIYFGSDRSGEWQIWKVGAWGGSPAQVTYTGGLAAEESLDGKSLFYVKQRGESLELWRIAVAGGSETLVSAAVHPVDWAAWTVATDGLLFVEHKANDDPWVSLFDFSSKQVKRLAVLDKQPFWIVATRDGKSLIFDQPWQFESHVALLEDFR